MLLPKDFEDYTRKLFGEDRWQRFVNSFDEQPPVSIRLNPFKVTEEEKTSLSLLSGNKSDSVPWCRNAYWLKERPDFTLDPLLHAGCYYVQEAGSMFLDEALRQHLPVMKFTENRVLDLCAAPGGKSTLLRAALDTPFRSTLGGERAEGQREVVLFSNEPDHRRANILMENLQKQGHPQVVVTSNYARDYYKSKLLFDVILTDVPCSGEGMFRKDEGAVKEWSIQNVMKCQELQRSIVADIWPCLKEGGLLIYSTCTFNTREDEENVRWICEELGAEVLPVEIKPEWNITGSLLEGFDAPVYRFIPGTTISEGLFLCVLRKTSDKVLTGKVNLKALHILSNGVYEGEIKGKNTIPDHAESLLINLVENKYPRTEVDLETALHYLRGEAIYSPLLMGEERGVRLLTYKGHPLGFVKNLGNRANNMYPQEWKIRKEI